MHTGLLIIPLVTAFTGWLVIWLAIKMLFHPRLPIYILGFHFQGIFPKKQKQLAEQLGKLVSNELISFAEIEEKIINPENLQKLMPLIDGHIDHFLRVKLVQQMPVIGMLIGDKTINELKTVFTAELEELFPVIMQNYMSNLQGELDLERIMIDKVAGFSSETLEQILYNTMSAELRFVGMMGGILGFIIGLLEVLISYLR